MTTLSLNVVKQVSPETPRPYRVIETYLTSEGPRTRVCSGAFSTQEDAQIWLEQLQEGAAHDLRRLQLLQSRR